jgi:hypothetical protein
MTQGLSSLYFTRLACVAGFGRLACRARWDALPVRGCIATGSGTARAPRAPAAIPLGCRWGRGHWNQILATAFPLPEGCDAFSGYDSLRGFGRRRDRFGRLLFLGPLSGCSGRKGSRHWASGRLAGRPRALISRTVRRRCHGGGLRLQEFTWLRGFESHALLAGYTSQPGYVSTHR